jgi:hypothetical protein
VKRLIVDAAGVAVIDRDAVYRIGQLTQLLGLRPSSLPREMKLGRLRHSKRSVKVYILGRWVTQWLEEGEVVRRRPRTTVTANGKS